MDHPKKKLAYLTARFPLPLDQGDRLRAFYQIKQLSKYYDIHLFSMCQELPTDQEISELRKYCKEIFFYKTRISSQIRGIVMAALGNYPFQTGIHFDNGFDKLISEKLEEFKIDILFVQLIRMTEYAQSFRGLRILDYMDAFSKSMYNRAQLSPIVQKWLYKIEAQKVEKYELSVQSTFDGFLFIAESDEHHLQLHDDDRSFIISNGIDQSRFYNDESIDIIYDIGFIGNLGYPPNQEAVKCLVEEIVPAFEEKFKQKLSLLIAGARAPEDWNRYENEYIKLGGRYEDINEAYNQIAVFCAFYYSSTGQQNKILEAMSAEVPVLCNPELNKAIKAINEKEIVLSETIDILVDKLKILLDNESKRKSIGKAASQLCKERFQWESIGYQLHLAIEQIGKRKIMSSDKN
jgi:polysaccharide biosynthesis protein PslH